MIEDIVFSLAKIFPEYDWDLEECNIKTIDYIILVNDFDFYMNNQKFKTIIQALRNKNPEVRFTCAYKKFTY